MAPEERWDNVAPMEVAIMLLFCDSFDHYDTALIGEKYLSTSNAAIVSGGGRRGTNCVSISYSQGSIQKAFADSATLIVGFAYNASQQLNYGLVVFYDYEGTDGVEQGQLRLNAAGGIDYYDGNGNLLASSALGLISLNTFQYIEISVTFSTTAASGSVSAQLNGQSIFSVGNVVTSLSGNNYANLVNVTYSGGSDTNILIDDLYICNGAGTVNNDFLGDVGVTCLLPNGEGQLDDFTPNGAPENYQCVSNNPPDDDNEYVSSAQVGTTDLYTIESLPELTSAVVAVQLVASARKDDSYTRVLALGFGNGTTSVFDGTFSLTSDYLMFTQPYDTNPITDETWGIDDVDNGQIGIQVVS